MWYRKRNKPYTKVGVSRLPCIRCGEKAVYQWQICSDGNNYRPICVKCDVALNRMILRWMKHPEAKRLADEYAFRQVANT